MSRFDLSRAAEDDLESVWDFIGIERDNPRAAVRVIDRIIETIELLAAQPMLGELRGDFTDVAPDIRSFSVANYVIFYRPIPGGGEPKTPPGISRPSGARPIIGAFCERESFKICRTAMARSISSPGLGGMGGIKVKP